MPDHRSRRIYLASSWRNDFYPEVLMALRRAGHEVYDFRNPAPCNTGFHWSDIDPQWQMWTVRQYARPLTSHPKAAAGYELDKRGLDWAEICVLLLPCGRSAHLEAGYAIGRGKPTIFYLRPAFEPELMYRLGQGFCFDFSGMLGAIDTLPEPAGAEGTLSQTIANTRCQRDTVRALYRREVASGRMRQETADRRIGAMEAVIGELETHAVAAERV